MDVLDGFGIVMGVLESIHLSLPPRLSRSVPLPRHTILRHHTRFILVL